MTKIFVLAVVTLWLVPGIRSLFEILGKAVKQRRQEMELLKNEAERLDRIRNPSKYLGK